MPDELNTTDERIATIARDLCTHLIDVGVACQKARSFTVASAGSPIRSVYDVYAERTAGFLREEFQKWAEAERAGR